jgi:hypothetical protein
MVAEPSFDWRDPLPYARLRGIDRAGLMWEWLRRDRAYIAWHMRATTVTGAAGLPASDLRQWGLHFRGTTGRSSALRPHRLACRP